jgi:hypothetical protein
MCLAFYNPQIKFILFILKQSSLKGVCMWYNNNDKFKYWEFITRKNLHDSKGKFVYICCNAVNF